MPDLSTSQGSLTMSKLNKHRWLETASTSPGNVYFSAAPFK